MSNNLSSVRTVALIGLVLLLAHPLRAQGAADTPESTIRQLVRAMYAADGASFTKLTLADPRIHLLTTGGSVNADGLRELDEDPTGVQIIPKRPFQYRGAAAKPGPAGKFPTGTTAVYVVAHHRSPLVMVLQREADGWKVDPRWWLSMVEMAQSQSGPKEGTAEYAARGLIATMIAMDKAEALRFATPGTSGDALFLGAPSQREPSGQLDALAMEMPIVELKPGEFRRL
ncbi:MAG: hypothetical protein ABI556_14150, partial [Gemmatimonadales bacterium]